MHSCLCIEACSVDIYLLLYEGIVEYGGSECDWEPVMVVTNTVSPFYGDGVDEQGVIILFIYLLLFFGGCD